MWHWLVHDWQWPAAACFTAVFLLVFTPLLFAAAGLALVLIYLQLPIYMLHQWEEHAGDRFRLYVNRVVGGGREALTRTATFWINSLGVWAVDLAALYLAWVLDPSAGLVAGYLAVVNAVPHLAATILRREYNPGVFTAAFLLLPVGGACVLVVGSGAGLVSHVVALVLAAGLHVAIVAYVARRLSALPMAAEPSLAADSGPE